MPAGSRQVFFKYDWIAERMLGHLGLPSMLTKCTSAPTVGSKVPSQTSSLTVPRQWDSAQTATGRPMPH